MDLMADLLHSTFSPIGGGSATGTLLAIGIDDVKNSYSGCKKA